MTLARYVYTPDPQEGTLLTPINNSQAVRWFIDNLPINRQGMDEFTRGLEIGLAHGYWLLGPFALLGPLRNTELGLVAGLLSAISLVLRRSGCRVTPRSPPIRPSLTARAGAVWPVAF